MATPEEFDRQDVYRRPDPLRPGFPGIHEVQPGLTAQDAPARTAGSPLPVGTGSRAQESQGYRSAPPPGRALAASAPDDGSNRAMAVLKQALPFVQKLLPLLEGNLGSAVANLLSPRYHTPAAPTVDLTPVHHQISELQHQQTDLRNQVLEQNTSIKRVEDQLEMVREATDRNTLEQQELVEDLKAVGNKVNLFALLMFAMLIVSLLLNVALFLHIKQVLP